MSSRRKPLNTKRADSEEKAETNGTADSDGEMDYLPEGTVVVKPEPVDKKGTFSGPEFRSKKKEKKEPSTDFNSSSAKLGRVSCTACGEQVNTNKSGSVKKHPQLKVLVCKSCYKFHTSGPISRDKDGLDEQCRWCSEGGKLFGCDFCHNAFCKACIIRNLGRSEISNVTEEGKDWKCYVCDSTLLKPLRAECQKVLDYMEAEDKKAKGKMKQATIPKSSDTKKSSDSTKKSNDSRKSSDSNIKSNDSKKSSDSRNEATESKSENKASKPTDSKQLLKVLSAGNPPSRSSSPSEFQRAILTQPHAGTTINTEKVVVDPKTGRSTKFEMVYPNANIVQTQYKSYARPQQPKPASLPTEGVSLPFTGLLPGNVHSIISNLLSMTDNLQQLLKNIQENVIAESNLDKLPFEISLRTLSQQQLQARLTAANCVKSAVNLFLQEMAMKTSAAGVKAMNLSQKASSPSLSSALLAGSPLDRNGGAMNVDTPHKFDKPGGENSPLVTSTPKPKPSDNDSDVIVLSPSPKKTVTQKSEKSDACATLQDDNDITISENSLAEKELLKDAAEEVGEEDNDSDNDDENDESSVKIGKTGKEDIDENINSENEEEESSEKEGKKRTGKLVNKLGNVSESIDGKGKNEKDEKEIVSSTTKEDEEEEDSVISGKTRSKKKDGPDTEDKECRPVRKTQSRSQDADNDSDSSQSRGKTSSKKESNDKSKTRENKKSTKEDLSPKKKFNASRSDSDKKSESKGKSKADDAVVKKGRSKDNSASDDNGQSEDEDSTDKKGKSKDNDGTDKKGKSKGDRATNKKGKSKDGDSTDKKGKSKDDSATDKKGKSKSVDDTDEEDRDSRDTEDGPDTEDKECKPVRKTRSRSQDADNDSDSSQSRGKTSSKKESNNKSKTSENKKSTKEDLSPKKKFNAPRSDSDKKSESKGKSKADDAVVKKGRSKDNSASDDNGQSEDEDSTDKKGKSKDNDGTDKKGKSKGDRVTNKKGKSKDGDSTDKKGKSKDDNATDKKGKSKSVDDTDEEDRDSSDTEEESDSNSDTSKDEDFVISKSQCSSRRLKKSASNKKPDKKKKTKDNDSSDFDSDLEKDIEKLSKTPTKSSKPRTARSSAKSEKSTKKPKESGGKQKTDKKKETSGDDSSVEDDETEEDDENTEIDEPEGEIDMDCTANTQAKEDLLKEMEEEVTDEENNQDSSDSEVIITPRKKESAVKKIKYTIDSDSGTEEDIPKKKRKRDELLDAKLSSSDSDVVSRRKSKKRKAKSSSNDTTETDSEDEFIALGKKKKGKGGKKKAGKGKARKRRRIKAPSSSDDDEEAVSEDENEQSASGSEEEGDPNTPKRLKRKKIRKIKSEKKLTSETKSAVKAEEERRKRVAEKQKIFNGIVQEVDESSPTKCPITKQLVLDFEEETKKPIIEVDKGLVVKLKPHQVEAVQFVWDCTFESIKRAKKEEGSGCILAHCMGLGKTLSLITYIHTVLTNSKKTNMHTCVVVAPLNTVLNWQYEFEMWQEFSKKEVDVYEMSSVKQNADRAALLKNWHRDGGVLILGYDMLRNLTQGKHCRSKNMKKIFTETLVDPGPDLVVCDEGHILKNDQSAISKAMNQIKSRRRIALTGTPLQNNLMEYHCMVDFVKPNLLGTSKEFRNRFVNPITNGQCADSTAQDVKVMKRRAHILHEKLNGCVQRKDYSSLTKYLPPKHEYVIAVRLSPVQISLYEKYLSLAGFGTDDAPKANRGAKLFSDYQALMRIWTHPWVLKMDEIRQADKRLFDDESDFVDDSDNDSDGCKSTGSADSSTPSEVSVKSDIIDEGRKTRSSKKKKESDDSDSDSQKKDEVVKKWTTRRQRGSLSEPEEDMGPQPVSNEWWAEYVKPEDEDKLELSGKLVLLFEILRMSEEIGDKVLVFSQSLLSLDLIEHFLEKVDQKNREDGEKPDDKGSEKKSEDDKKKEDKNEGEEFGKHWTLGEDYFRMDGSHSAQARKNMAEKFNDPENYQCRLFLISTKAGGLGINLVAANRVIIFDASWNPSHDVQSIFRVYRFGQEKPVYVYRFLAQGTMEEKIYERQVTKQSLSQRVIDEHQIDRHFNSNELAELYTFRPDRLDDPNRVEKTPMLPKDFMLAELMKSQKDWFVNYHEHDSLLENKIEEILDEDERKAAWEEYENERKGVLQMRQNFMANMPNMGFNNMVQQMQQPSHYGMPYMYGQGFNMQAFTQQNLLQLVQDMKQRYPHLPQEQLTQQVQTVIRQMVSRQIAAQQDAQKRQIEQKELHHQRELQRIQDQIRHQQMQLMQATMAGNGPELGEITPRRQAGTSSMQSLLNQPSNAALLQQMREARK